MFIHRKYPTTSSKYKRDPISTVKGAKVAHSEVRETTIDGFFAPTRKERSDGRIGGFRKRVVVREVGLDCVIERTGRIFDILVADIWPLINSSTSVGWAKTRIYEILTWVDCTQREHSCASSLSGRWPFTCIVV